jgi:hypothetical protein
MFGNNFWKTLGQKRIQVLVGSAVAYTDSTTYEGFLTEAVEGEIGFFNAATGAVITGAIGSTTKFFAGLKRDGRIMRTTPSLGSEVTKAKTAYAAPVKQESDVAFGTRATLTVGNIVYTARKGGTAGNSVTVTVVDSASNNVALSIGVSGTAITVNLATDGASAPTSTGAQVLAALRASATASALATFDGTGTMSTVQAAASVANLAGGAEGTAPAVGNIYQLEIMDLTTAAQPFPTYMYEYVAKASDTLITVNAALAALINSTTSFANRDKDLIVDATATSDDILTLKAKDYGTFFKVLIREKLGEIATVTDAIKAKVGSGYYQQVQMLEQAGDIFGGVTTNYPENHATPDEFGKPASLVLAANTYNMYQWTKVPVEASRTPHNTWTPGTVFFAIAVPSNGTNPSSSIDTILGL